MTTYYPLASTAADLIEQARNLTGIDIEDTDAHEPLSVLIRSLNTEAGLHQEGARRYEQWLLRVLCNRLRMRRDFLQHPEIADQPVTSPLFVYGPPRSGTTKLQKVLAASGDFNWMQFWHTFNPSLITGDPAESQQQRIDEAEEFVRWIEKVTPDAQLGHAAETFEPEEDTFWSDHCLLTPAFNRYVSIPSYLEWMATQDMGHYFRELKKALQYFQWQRIGSPDKRWLLKSPIYPGLEPLIVETFPDASLVMTHRHPYEIVGSGCRLQSAMFPAFTHQPIDYHALVPGIGGMLTGHVHMRKDHPEINILDIKSIDGNQSIMSTLASIYDFIRLPMSAHARANIMQWESDNPMHKKGAFVYTLEQYGVEKKEIDEGFADYLGLLSGIGFLEKSCA
jgi:Sulfotransferase family